MKKLLKIGFVAVAMLFAAPKLYAQISIGITISAHVAPPPLPTYTQPSCPVDGYLWVPGYWAWDPDVEDYYWVPGVWVAPPQAGYLWTPAYWGYENGVYGFHPGYWGPHVGFYGGINYGYGYNGVGFVGGAWSGRRFRYNTAVVNVNRTVIHNTYIDRTVIVNHTVVNNHVSFNGGTRGVQAKPRPEELAAMRDHHIEATSRQQSHQHNAMQDRSQFSKSNRGRPTNVAMNRVGGEHFNPQGKKEAHTATPQKPVARTGQRPDNANQEHNKPTMRQTNPERNNPVNDNKPNNRVKTSPAHPGNQPRPENQPRINAPKTNQQPMQRRPQQPPMQQQQRIQQHPQQRSNQKPQPHADQRPPEKEHQ